MGRIGRFFSSVKTWVVSLWRTPPKPKTPEQILDGACKKMSANLRRSKNQVSVLLNSQKSLQDQINRNINKATQLQVKALSAVGRGQEERARDLLHKKQRYEKTVASLKQQLRKHKGVTENLAETVRRLELKLDETKRKKVLLITQKQTYEATRMITENIEGYGEGEDGSVGRVLNTLEEDVLQLETEAKLHMGMDLDSIEEEEYDALPPGESEGPTGSVEDELEAMKLRLKDSGPDDTDEGDPPKDGDIVFIE